MKLEVAVWEKNALVYITIKYYEPTYMSRVFHLGVLQGRTACRVPVLKCT